jgi:hypothetical protein
VDRHQKVSPATVFYVYAREDEPLRDELSKHLKNLVRQGLVKEWYDRQIFAGTDWASTIDKHLQDASIVLLLLSPDFFASDYCVSTEMQQALERHHMGEAHVIPILLRPVDWQDAPFAGLQCLPHDAKPVTSWSNRDDAFLDITKGIRAVINNTSIPTNQTNGSLLPHIWNIPYPRNPFFTGRDDLLTYLSTSLKAGHVAALMQPKAISGLGGIGKTQIAVEYAYRHSSEYRAILWVRGDTRENVISSFVTIANLLNLPTKSEKDQKIVVQAVLHWLRVNADWLLIFDNADDLEMVREFFPTTFGGHFILTTRAQAMGRLAEKIEVEIMPSEEGILLLLRRAGIIADETRLEDAPKAERNAAIGLVQELEGLPLAIDQAGAYIEEVGCGVDGYLRSYQKRRATLLNRRGGLVNDHPASVAATWSLSFEKIEQADPVAADLLRLCAFLAPDAIPEEILTTGANHLGPQLQAIAIDQGVLDEAIMTLRTYSFIRRNVASKLLSIHRLVQAVLKDGMDEPTSQTWTERAVFAVNEVFPRPDFAVWSRCERYISNAQVCAALIEQRSMTRLEAAQLLLNAGRYLNDRGSYSEAEPLLKRSLTIREHLLGSEHLDTAVNLNVLGNLYSNLGRYTDAEALLKQTLAIREQQLGMSHPATATSLNCLALLYLAWRKYSEAEPLFQRALAIREQSSGSEDRDTIAVMNNLGALYRREGRYIEAEPLVERALAIREQLLGPEHPDTAASLNDLGLLYCKEGRYIEAEPLLEGCARDFCKL